MATPHLKASVEVRLAELRVLRERLEEAQELLVAVGEHPDAARSLPLLHLTEGRPPLDPLGARRPCYRRGDQWNQRNRGRSNLAAAVKRTERSSIVAPARFAGQILPTRPIRTGSLRSMVCPLRRW